MNINFSVAKLILHHHKNGRNYTNSFIKADDLSFSSKQYHKGEITNFYFLDGSALAFCSVDSSIKEVTEF